MDRSKVLQEYVEQHGGKRVLKRILIANNGMAATKAILSMRQWTFLTLGSDKILEFVAMASPNDLQANAEYIRLADSFVEVPPGKNLNNYANVELICTIAKEQEVDAVWPGWGHASEKPELPRALASIGITFLGPTAPVMHALGDKIASTILAQSSKVPCIPWNGDGIFAEIQPDGSIPEEPFKRACLQSYEEALQCAKRIGYPVVLKASEGGGGKGIRKATNDEELKVGWEQVTTEVVGSPIFMMQLCVGARHLEVQLVGDEHGEVVALIGRDCSTQRRFQKIFEEGPPTIADKDDFRGAEKAAQRLAKSVGYRGAGTVEFLYKPDTKTFSFLELNPRLQVEHPVTEGITGVNVPALQLQVGMGIPLCRMPDIRRFYGLEPSGSTPIDFLEDKYVYPNCHVIAARVTAENPDDAFRPTSGRIERVRFQSSPATWGYFSIGANGNIHEFADSQFGHIFAKGPTREDARKALQLALQNVSVKGDIRTPVEYLVELAETKEFRENTIDTAWLDKLIAEKAVKSNFNAMHAILHAACFRAFQHVKEKKAVLLDNLKRGHLPLQHELRVLQSFDVEVAYESTRYLWQVVRTREDCFALTIDRRTFEASIRQQPDESLYVKVAGRVTQISGVEEPLGLRLRMEGTATIVFPRIRDPSELRSDFNGKLVRYLHSDGAEVMEGEPFCELEAMKMIMSLRATASGKIRQRLGPGAIVAAGQLLADLDLKDPSSVQMVKTFKGTFTFPGDGNDEAEPESQDGAFKFNPPPRGAGARSTTSMVLELPLPEAGDTLEMCVRGFGVSPRLDVAPTQIAQRLFPDEGFSGEADEATSLAICARVLERFLEIEQFFAGLVGGDETQIKGRFQGEAVDLLNSLIAHDNFDVAADIVNAILRNINAHIELGVPVSFCEQLKQAVVGLSNLPKSGGYSLIKMLAAQTIDFLKRTPITESRKSVRDMLSNISKRELRDLAWQGSSQNIAYFGLELIASFFADEDPTVRSRAVELYIRRMYRGYTIGEFDVMDSKDVSAKTPAASLQAMWDFGYPGNQGTPRKGYAIVLPDIEAFTSLQKDWVLPSPECITGMHILVARGPAFMLKDVLAREQALQKLTTETNSFIGAVASMFEAKGIQKVQLSVCNEGGAPEHMHFAKAADWKEIMEFRSLRPSFPVMMELPILKNDMTLTKLASTKRHSVFAGTGEDKSFVILSRSLSYQESNLENFGFTVLQELLEAFDVIDRSMLDPAVADRHPASRLFVHFVRPIPSCTERDLILLRELFTQVVQHDIAEHGPRLLKLNIERIEVKVWVQPTKDSEPIPLKLLSLRSAGWECMGFKEVIDSSTGLPVSWIDVDSETQTPITNLSAVTSGETKIQIKRATARRADSTYIYDFLMLFRIALTQLWMKSKLSTDSSTATSQKGLRRIPTSAGSLSRASVPAQLFKAVELVLQDGELIECQRPAGQNNVGMVAFRCTLHTPEYPEGRDMILVGNDMTIKAGSFGTVEDEVFQKASALARKLGIPRIYIACNSGARLGVVEELKSLVQVAWVDKADLNKGFEYLYLTDEALQSLPEHSVRSHPVQVGSETRHVLDAILGLHLPSTKGGIGVENLQGSGLIAGETSRAYEETFTLSYVTGRSVGIGAYLNRLGQRNIQMVHGPMILTGFQALNKLLGQKVYTTQDQLGGPHIMVPNGITHELVHNDQEGVSSIIRWLSYVAKDVSSVPPVLSIVESIDREIEFFPSKAPYDPRHMLAGGEVDGVWKKGFCDEGSFTEYMEGWGKTVIVGRGRVGGLPVGIVAVETRSVERHIPADPADLTSRDTREAQAGQVWYPDSAFKTATAIRDFNRGENLPLVIFANWRGFSGGTRDMFAEVLKYGAMIVDALVEYKHPVTIYIPPNGELRGGAWVVLDPKINPEKMEMFADVEARGGILEPPAASEIVFKADAHVLQMMHRCDEKLKELDAKKAAGEDVSKAMKEREKLLLPMYKQVAVTYCDLHDKSARMKCLGAIREELNWPTSRSYLHWRIRRRMQEGGVINQLMKSVPGMALAEASEVVRKMVADVEAGLDDSKQDQAVAQWIESNQAQVQACIQAEKDKATEEEVFRLIQALPDGKRGDVVRDLVGFTKVARGRP